MSASGAAPGLPKILVIDANVFFAKRLADALKKEGFEVTHSTQTAFALTSLEWDTPIAILCATNLREMSAFELPKLLDLLQNGGLIQVSEQGIDVLVPYG